MRLRSAWRGRPSPLRLIWISKEAKSLDPIETHPETPTGGSAIGATSDRRRYKAWALFAALAAAIVVSDQLLKQWIVANYEPGTITPVLGDWLRIDLIHNAGGLFGLLQGTAAVFAVVTLVVVGLIASMELRWGWRSWVTTLALGLLLGGAIGNFIDRIRLGYVVDFADIGIGRWRWYIFNVADMAVSCFFLVLLALWIIGPMLQSRGRGAQEAAPSSKDAEGPVAG